MTTSGIPVIDDAPTGSARIDPKPAAIAADIADG